MSIETDAGSQALSSLRAHQVISIEMDVDKASIRFSRKAIVLARLDAPGGSLQVLRLVKPVWFWPVSQAYQVSGNSHRRTLL